MLLPGANAERAAEVVGRLRVALAQAHLLSGTPVFTASFGISDSTMTHERETLIRLADEALYRSKQAGATVARLAMRSSPARRSRDASETRARWSTLPRWRAGVNGDAG